MYARIRTGKSGQSLDTSTGAVVPIYAVGETLLTGRDGNREVRFDSLPVFNVIKKCARPLCGGAIIKWTDEELRCHLCGRSPKVEEKTL